jgi:hypothetical protein
MREIPRHTEHQRDLILEKAMRTPVQTLPAMSPVEFYHRIEEAKSSGQMIKAMEEYIQRGRAGFSDCPRHVWDKIHDYEREAVV